MKNLLSILFLFCLSFTLKAQVVTPVIAGGTVTDRVSWTGTGTMVGVLTGAGIVKQ